MCVDIFQGCFSITVFSVGFVDICTASSILNFILLSEFFSRLSMIVFEKNAVEVRVRITDGYKIYVAAALLC